jgi:hypothetical protein
MQRDRSDSVANQSTQPVQQHGGQQLGFGQQRVLAGAKHERQIVRGLAIDVRQNGEMPCSFAAVTAWRRSSTP